MDKYQEALERARICGDNACCDCKFNEICINDKKGWYGTLKELVDKATPKKPYYLNYGGYQIGHWKCPSCDLFVTQDNYCKYCGQALDWGDEDDK